MLINGKDLENYSCSLIDRKITPTEVITYNEWLDGAIQPTFVRQQDGFKTIEVVLIMKAESELDAQYLISELTRDAKKCEVNFDEDMDELYYDCVLAATPTVERLKPSVFQITLNFQSGYACGKRVTINPDIRSGEISLKVKGTTAAPIIFTLTPIASSIVEVNVGGITSQPCKLIDIPANYSLVIDAENNKVELVAKDGSEVKPAIDCYTNCWEMPKLQPGKNTITLDYVTGYNVSISYRPRYI